MERNKKRMRIIGMIILIIVLLLLLFQCGGETEKEAQEQNKNPVQELLDEMKADEEALLLLYERGDVCSEAWIEEFMVLAKKFQNYRYAGNEEDIQDFLKEYKIYGERLEEIGELLTRDHFDESIERLVALEDYAEEMEGKLNQLYEKYHQED